MDVYTRGTNFSQYSAPRPEVLFIGFEEIAVVGTQVLPLHRIPDAEERDGVEDAAVDRLPGEKFEELRAANERTEQELKDLESRMGRFASKGSYRPTTPGDRRTSSRLT